MNFLVSGFLIVTIFQIISVKSVGLNEEFSWTRLTYAWKSESGGSNGGQINVASRFGEYSPSSYNSGGGQVVGYSTSVSSSVTMSEGPGQRQIPVGPTNKKNSGSYRPQQTVVVEEVPYTNWDKNNQNGNPGNLYGSGNMNMGTYGRPDSSTYGNQNVGNHGSYGGTNTGQSYGSYGGMNTGGDKNQNMGSYGSTNTGSQGSPNTGSYSSINTGGGNGVPNISPSEQNTNYDYVTNIPMGANVWQNKLFITVPRRRAGVPSTLNYVPLNSKQRHNVPLIPYPSWRQNAYPDQTGSGENIVSVYRVAVDICDRLWFVDTGILETLGNRTVAKPHELVVMDLQTDRIIHRYSLPDSVVTPATVLASLTVDSSKEDCGNAYVYFPDLAGYGLIVYSLRENRAWRVSHNYFYLEPQAGEFRISGHDFQWNDGVFSVELTDKKPEGFRDMYFHSMAGTHMYKVSTRVLRNETMATRSYHEDDFQIVGDRGPHSQTSSADIHKKSNVMFLGLVNQNALGCWNINNDLKTISIVQKDDEKMIYPSDVKVAGDKVYVLTNTMPEFLYGRLDYNKTNFRVWANDVSSAISGTKCQKKASNGY